MKPRRSPPDPQLYVRVLENVDRPVIALDREGRISLFNPAAQNCTGFSERQALDQDFEDLFAGQEGLLYLVRSSLREGRSISDHENILLRRPIGPALSVSVSVSPLLNDLGEPDGAIILIRDLSRIRELEEAVRRADRLSMLGAMAAGLAHEIKNPLGGIRGAAQLLAHELGPQKQLTEYTDVMIREVERVNTIIEELMDLTRSRPMQLSEVNLGRILGDIVLFQKEARYGDDVEFVLHLDPSIPPLLGDADLLARLFLNLIKNAAEAIDKRGKVEIISKVASEFHVHKPGARPVPMIRVEIRDSGKGIAAAELENIFTPFFTTKDYGSGLGLATCQKIVNQHHGLIKVESTVGIGSVFTVSLPFLR